MSSASKHVQDWGWQGKREGKPPSGDKASKGVERRKWEVLREIVCSAGWLKGWLFQQSCGRWGYPQTLTATGPPKISSTLIEALAEHLAPWPDMSFAVRCGHVTGFWPIKCEQKK